MQYKGRITVRGIVQGVGFRPFVFAKAAELGIAGTVKNLGSEVEIFARGGRFDEFLAAVSRGPPLARIDSVECSETNAPIADGFAILKSGTGSFSGMIPPDIAICGECIGDIFTRGGHYENYWATSCVNCGPRYSIIHDIPYDRERTSMAEFPMCPACAAEYFDPHSRRHHAQTIACASCGPALTLFDKLGRRVDCPDPIAEAAGLLDAGFILAMRGIGGFHLACVEESADDPEAPARKDRTALRDHGPAGPARPARLCFGRGPEAARKPRPPDRSPRKARPDRPRRDQQPAHGRLHAPLHRPPPPPLLAP